MFTFGLFIISFFLTTIIFLRIPKETVGLQSFAAKSPMLGSPTSAERLLNIFTAFGIFLYMYVAVSSATYYN